MRSYNHCLFDAERRAFQRLDELFGEYPEVELFPNFDLRDENLKTFLECDLIVIAKSFCAIVELKNWRGLINVGSTYWERNGNVVTNPHRSNIRKCKVLKATLQQLLPHVAEIPYVQSIVVLTHPDSEVFGDSSVYTEVGAEKISGEITFNGVKNLADYIQRKTGRDATLGRNVLKDQSFRKIVENFDAIAKAQEKKDYYDQIPGYRVIDELEHTEECCAYLAEKVPPLGGQRFRLRVFGELSNDPMTQAVQTRSLQELATLPHHDNILPALSHPNEKNLVVEVSEWTDLRTLEACLLKDGRIQWETAAKIALGVARALNHIHNSSRLLVHRNVNPKSIILNSENVPKLTDFDLVYDPDACQTVFFDSRRPTSYQAPELLQGTVDFKSDIYSWGMVFYEMMAGKTLVLRPGSAITNESLAALPPEVPESLRNLLVDTMKVAVAERPEASEVVERLEMILGIAKPAAVSPRSVDSSNTWQLLEKIAEGATSHVYAGDCLGERAVLKLYKPEIGRDRCLQERDMLRLVDSPYVPKYKSFIRWEDGRWCLIEEEVKGERVRDLIDAGNRPSFSAFREVTRQLLSALQSMHPKDEQDQGGVIHNDVNPNNILLDTALMRATLIDFGAASPVGPITFRGTCGYISADLLENGEIDAQPKGDLYGLAVTLWEWITGSRSGESLQLDVDSFPSLTLVQRSTLSAWFAKGMSGGVCEFNSAAEMFAEFEAVLDAQETRVEVQAEKQVEEQEVFVSQSAEPRGSNAERFVEYLNSIHNVSASNKNALAESQAVSEFFGDIYQPFPIVEEIFTILTTKDPAPVVVLTGHAGDGKSTIALDVLKRMRGIPLDSPLPDPPKEREWGQVDSRGITIVKDMSEISATERYQIFCDCLTDSSSAWLIVSNTGPLLGTFDAYYENVGPGERQAIEKRLLEVLDTPIEEHLSEERHTIKVQHRAFYTVNLTKLDNVGIGTKVLQKIVDHRAWESCSSCSAAGKCHIATNIEVLRGASSVMADRVRYVYRRLSSYEQRMTLRQMSAHLSYSLTAGVNCGQIRSAARRLESPNEVATSIADVCFCEVFFGSSQEAASAKEESIHAIQLLNKLQFGAEVSPELERSIMEGKALEWAVVPPQILPVYDVFMRRARRPEAIVARRTLRRLLYLFGAIDTSPSGPSLRFLSLFLQSPKLIEFDQWQQKGALTMSNSQKRDLTKKTVNVLLEEYSGNSAGQYEGTSYLYVTLRRSDRQVFQATQLVLARFDTGRFDIEYDQTYRVPKLCYKDGQAELLLTLPLLDYIMRRGDGDLEDGLDPIYLNQLEYFRAQLLSIDPDMGRDINLLRVGIDGKVDSHRYEYQADTNSLELVE